MTNGKWSVRSIFTSTFGAPVRRLLLILSFTLLSIYPFTLCSGQEVVDKTVATVNGGVRTDLITYSDLLWQLALEPHTVLTQPTSEALNGALRLVEDQRLILQEAVKLPTLSPSEQEITEARDTLAKHFASRDELEQRMISVGLTSEKLNEMLEQRVQIEKYLEFRFRSFIVIGQKDVADYYRETWVPRFKSRSPRGIIPTLEEARPEIEKTLTETKVESDIDSFLDNARDRAEIVVLNPV